MNHMAGPVVGIALIAAVAAGVYAYTLHGELFQAKAALAVAQQNLDASKRTADDGNKKYAVAKSALDTCVAQLTDVQSKLDALVAKPGHRRLPLSPPNPDVPESHP